MAGALAERVALVTGGSSGIGRAAAVVFAREGARVVVADVDPAGGEATVGLVREAGGAAIFVRTDVTREVEVAALVQAAVERFGRLDCAFNNAGIGEGNTRTHHFEEAVFDRVIAINLKGVWLCMKHEIEQMLRQGGGAIVNTASAAGLVGLPGSSAYVASKHGVVGLTKTAAVEYARQGIRVNAVCPGFIRTPMTQAVTPGSDTERRVLAYHPIGRLGRPEEVAEAAVWLCTDAASFVTGTAFSVDGGVVAM